MTVADPNAAPVDETVLQSGEPVASFASAAISGQEPVTPSVPTPQPEANSNVPGSYPTFYEKAAKARASGYSWEEIGDHLVQGRQKALAAGYTNAEINQHLGMDPSWDQPNTPLDYIKPQIPAGNGADQAAQTVRDFAAKYLTPDTSSEAPGLLPAAPIRTTGDFLKMMGHDIGDVGKIFGGGVVQGLASTLEMMDGKPRSTEEWSQLNAEAMNFTAFLAGKGPGLKTPDPRLGQLGLPATKDVVDAAGSIVHPPEAAAVAQVRELLAGERAPTVTAEAARTGEVEPHPSISDQMGGNRLLRESYYGLSAEDQVRVNDLEAQMAPGMDAHGNFRPDKLPEGVDGHALMDEQEALFAKGKKQWEDKVERRLNGPPAEAPAGTVASLPVVNMQSLKLLSEEAKLKQQHAELTELHGNIEVAPDAAAARDLLAKVDVVQAKIDDPNIVGDELKALKLRKDELLQDTNPETLREKAGALEMQRQTAAQIENVQAQLDDVRAQQAKLQTDAALTPTPAGADMATVMRNLGQNFVDTGEHPLDAAARAQSDPALMTQLQAPHPDVPSSAPPPPAPGMIRYFHGTGYTDAAGFEGKTFVSPQYQYARDYHGGPNNVFYTDLTKEEAAARGLYDEINNYPRNGSIDDGAARLKPHTVDIAGQSSRPAGGANTVFTDDMAAAARERLKARSSTFNSGIDPQDFADLLTIAGYHIERGARSFASFSARMIEDVGEAVRPHLQALYDQAMAGRQDAPAGDITPQSIQFRNPAMSTGIIDNFKRIFNPAARTAEASDTAGVLREAMARQKLAGQMSDANLRRFGRAVADLTPEQQAEFIHAYESGDLSYLPAGSPLHELAAEIKAELDVRWLKMDERGAAPGYIENYLPHLYEDADVAMQRLPAYRGQKSATGSTPFTKERIFSSFLDAANALDLKPLTTNPVELVMTHLFQADKYIASLDVVAELKAAGLIKAMPNNLTRAEAAEFAGTMRVDPSIAKGTGGQWVAAEPVATLLNRWLSPGLTGQPIFDVLRSGGNMLNMAQLGMSAFHSGFVVGEAIAGATAKGIKQISRLQPAEVARGVGSVLSAPAAPVFNGLVGRKVIQQILGKADFGPEVQTIADALLAGGGRVDVDPMYKATAMGSFWSSMKSSIRNGGEMSLAQDLQQMYHDAKPLTIKGTPILPGAVRATAMLLPRIMDTLAAPISEHLVPMMKVGGFANMMADELRVNPNMSPLEIRDVAGRIWHSIDNRLGQMVYDNRFWDKNMRDMGHISVRSLGWTAGTIDEIAGGAIDLTQGRKISAGEMHQLTERASYVIGLPVATAMMGAIFGTVYGTWSPDWGIKDYLFPPTGGKDAQGGPERASMPGYMKDAYEWGTDPGHTAISKIHPLWSTLVDMMGNSDWNGAAITDPRQSFPEEAGDYAKFIARQFTPIVMQPRKANEADSGLGFVARQVGLRPAPYALREPERQAAWGMRDLVSRLKKKQRADAQLQ